jgi:uncharacterized protein (UPF0335 family)
MRAAFRRSHGGVDEPRIALELGGAIGFNGRSFEESAMAKSNPQPSPDSVAQDQIRAIIERVERMEEEKRAISDDIKEIYAEAKGNGFDTKVLRQIVRIRKQDASERAEQEALLELYMSALGMAYAPREAAE